MEVTPVGIVILVNLLQPKKALAPMEVTPLGIIILVVNAIQPEKALAPMEVTLVGILILVNKEQPKKALAPIEVTLVGIVILVNEEQPEKALAAILVTPLVGIFITAIKLVRSLNPDKVAGVPVVVYVNPPSSVVQLVIPDQFVFVTTELKTKVKFVSSSSYLFAKGAVFKASLVEFILVTYKFAVEEILVNTSVPILIDALDKMYTLFNKLQPLKALFPMEIKLELVGIVILVNEEQL
jgi:hypothetical protein